MDQAADPPGLHPGLSSDSDDDDDVSGLTSGSSESESDSDSDSDDSLLVCEQLRLDQTIANARDNPMDATMRWYPGTSRGLPRWGPRYVDPLMLRVATGRVRWTDATRRRWVRLVQSFQESTHVAHNQCADAVVSLGGHLLVVSKNRHVGLFHLDTGATSCVSPLLPFDIYSMTAEPDTGLVAVCGAERTSAHHNVGLLRLTGASSHAWEVLTTFGCGSVSPRTGAVDQANGVRFAGSLQAGTDGVLHRRPVLLVGSQDKRVYVFAMPQEAPGTVPQLLRSFVFPTAINCACASPDGKWLAATGDREEVYLRGGSAGFLDDGAGAAGGHAVMRLRPGAIMHSAEPRGCQYLAWSADSRYLAASSDSSHAVAVWGFSKDAAGASAAAKDVCRFERHVVPVLALSFVGDSHVLAYAEQHKELFLVDVDAAPRWARQVDDRWMVRPLSRLAGMDYLRTMGMQRLRLETDEPAPLPMMWQPAHLARQRVTGLCSCGAADLVVALPNAIFRMRAVTAWSKELHYLFPPPFRAAARELLLCALAQRPTTPGEPPSVASLPHELVLRILAFAALPQTSWLTVARMSAAEEHTLERSWRRTDYDEESLSEEDWDDEEDEDEDEDMDEEEDE